VNLWRGEWFVDHVEGAIFAVLHCCARAQAPDCLCAPEDFAEAIPEDDGWWCDECHSEFDEEAWRAEL